MVNKNKLKGRRTVQKVIDWHVREGWEYGIVERSSKFVKVKDLFGLFDIVFIKGRVLKLVQCKTNKPPIHKLYKEWARVHASTNVLVECWSWFDREGFKVWKYAEEA